MEQKVGSRFWQESLARLAATGGFDPERDDHTRMRDGWWLVAEVAAGDRLPCPSCGLTCKVPRFEFAEVQCERCQRSGRDGKFIAGHFGLDDRLLDYVRRLTQLDAQQEADAGNVARHDRLLSQALTDAADGLAERRWAMNNTAVFGSRRAGAA